MRVCIVDDIVENAKYVQRVLADYETYLFDKPREALEFVRVNPIDILVTDQKMPVLTGIELVQSIREFSDDFVALVISAYTDSDDLIDAVNSNLIYKHIVKPFSPQVLLQHVQRACEKLELLRSNATLQQRLRIQNEALQQENRALRQNLAPAFDIFVGEDPAMDRVRELTQIYAGSEEPVLVTGETSSFGSIRCTSTYLPCDRGASRSQLSGECSGAREHPRTARSPAAKA